jgi:hypothetical protein
MTRKKFRDCTDPVAMVEMIHGMVSSRKLRLYFCGGCRRLEHLIFDPKCRAALEVIERDADDLIDAEKREEAFQIARYDSDLTAWFYDYHDAETLHERFQYQPEFVRRLVELGAVSDSVMRGEACTFNREVLNELITVGTPIHELASTDNQLIVFQSAARSCRTPTWPGRWLKDCVFANPFRPVAIPLECHTSTAVAIARGIYDDRGFERMPILGDALEDAGCVQKDVQAHCRSAEPHVRGCWVVDQLLGYE